jgi:hypothetical protein
MYTGMCVCRVVRRVYTSTLQPMGLENFCLRITFASIISLLVYFNSLLAAQNTHQSNIMINLQTNAISSYLLYKRH